MRISRDEHYIHRQKKIPSRSLQFIVLMMQSTEMDGNPSKLMAIGCKPLVASLTSMQQRPQIEIE